MSPRPSQGLRFPRRLALQRRPPGSPRVLQASPLAEGCRRDLRGQLGWAATTRPYTQCGETNRRWAETIHAHAAAARNTRSAMEWRPDMDTRNASSILQLGAVDLITDLPTALT